MDPSGTEETIGTRHQLDSLTSKGLGMTTNQPDCGDRAQLSATAEQLQTLADLIQRYPAEAQLIMTALEDGLTIGPMRVMETHGNPG
jgi:hypothetical protein